MKVITVANRKGGSGKSTCTSNIAMEAALNGYKVLLVDVDPQETLTIWYEKWDGGVDNLTLLKKVQPSQIEGAINRLKEEDQYDVCFIDTPGYETDSASTSIDVSDYVLLPCKPLGVDIDAASRTIAYAQKEKKTTLFLISQVIPKTSFEELLPILSIFSRTGILVPGYFSINNDYGLALSSGKTIHDFPRKQEKKEVKAIWDFLVTVCNITKAEDLKKPQKKMHLSGDSLVKTRGRPKKGC